MYTRQESEYYRAKQKAAQRIARGWVKPADLPSNAEIRDEILAMTRLFEGDQQRERLLEMRLSALSHDATATTIPTTSHRVGDDRSRTTRVRYRSPSFFRQH